MFFKGDLVVAEFDDVVEFDEDPQIHDPTKSIQADIIRLVSDTRIGNPTARRRDVVNLLDAIMPDNRVEEHYSNASKILESTGQNSRFEVTKFAIYLLSNNQIKPLSIAQAGAVLQWLHRKGDTRLLESSLSVNLPTIQALKEAIFRVALRTEDIEIVRLVLKSGLDLNEPIVSDYQQARTPLQFVCQRGNLEIARLLIEEGANVDASSAPDQRSALTYAAGSSNVELIKMLITAMAKINPDSIFAETPLHVAAFEDNFEAMELLLSAGALVNRADKKQETSLHKAARTCNINAIETLLQAGADIDATNEKGEIPLDLMFERYILMRDEEDAGPEGSESFHDAHEKSISSIYCLLNACPRSLERVSALGFAVAHGDAELVRECLRNGSDVNSLIPFINLPPVDGHEELKSITLLTVAALCNKVEIVSLLLAEEADVDADFTGVSPLQVAMLHEGTEILRSLLLSDADVDLPAHKENDALELRYVGTALQTAAFQGNQLQCEILSRAGADVNADAGEMGFTALQAAAQTHRSPKKLVKFLVELGAEINAPALPGKGLTALQAAVEEGNLDVVYYLVQMGADVNAPAACCAGRIGAGEGGITALAAAARRNNQQLVQFLLCHGADVNGLSPQQWAETALTAAIHARNDLLTRLLLASGAKVHDSALSAAIKFGSDETIRLLLFVHPVRASFVDLPVKGYDSAALQWAVVRGGSDLVRFFLESSIDINQPIKDVICNDFNGQYSVENRHVLEAAVTIDNAVMLQTLLDSGADPNLTSPDCSRTVLQFAAYREKPELVRLLLDAGADPNAPARGLGGRTALQAASEKGHFGLVKMLLEAGADTNAPAARDRGVSALQAAVIGGYCGIVRRLLEDGADPNAEGATTEGRTAIEGAAEYGRIDVLQLLLENGALIEGPGRAQYDRAISFAAEWGFPATRNLLQSHHQMLYGCI